MKHFQYVTIFPGFIKFSSSWCTIEQCLFDFSSQENATEKLLVKPPAEGQQHVRVVAQRGKSMEELGASKVTKTCSLSKSSEQLDQLWRSSAGPGGSNRDPLFIKAKEQERDRRNEAKEEIFSQKNTQGPVQNQTQKRSPLKQKSESQEKATGTKNSSRPTSPASRSSSRARSLSGSHSPVTDESTSKTPSPRAPETSEREISSASSTPTQTNRPCFK